LNEQLADLHKRHEAAWNKFTYFILAITAASIAFALQRSEGASVDWTLLFLAFGLCLWALSFWCGISELKQASHALQKNYTLLEIEAGVYGRVSDGNPDVLSVKRSLSEAIKEAASKADTYHSWQLRLYISGAVSYVFWHFARIFLG
jgi:hypothetical protein